MTTKQEHNAHLSNSITGPTRLTGAEIPRATLAGERFPTR